MFKLSSTPLEKINLKEGLISSEAGGFCAFEGRVRDCNEGKKVIALEYEAHEPLCQSEAVKIFKEVQEKFKIIEARSFHRIGKLSVGEMALWVGVAAPHRDDAFKACRYIIDEIKHRLPIWKKEYYADGDSGWVNCSQPSSVNHRPSSQRTTDNKQRTAEQEYYSRQTILPEIGAAGQAQIKSAKVLVVGAGGLGSSALISLASTGVGTIGICEFDILEESNLHRQFLYSHQDIGQPKIELAASRLKALNPYIQIQNHPAKLDIQNAESIISGYDIILDCTDNFYAKYLLNDACVLKKKILIQASIYQFEGQLHCYVPGQTGCLRCLWAQTPQQHCVGTCAEVGVLGVVPSILGHMQALEAIKMIVHHEDLIGDEMIIYNFLTHGIHRVKNVANPYCTVCGAQPEIVKLQKEHYAQVNRVTIDIAKLPPKELNNFIFIDIREPFEISMHPARGVEAVSLPLSRYKDSHFEFDTHKRYIIFCAKGGRSHELTRQLHTQGIANVFSLEGGLESLENYFKPNITITGSSVTVTKPVS